MIAFVTNRPMTFLQSNGNAFVSEAGGLRFKSRAGQTGHSVPNGWPLLQHFFEWSCIALAQQRGDGPRQLVTRFGVKQRVWQKIWFDNVSHPTSFHTVYSSYLCSLLAEFWIFPLTISSYNSYHSSSCSQRKQLNKSSSRHQESSVNNVRLFHIVQWTQQCSLLLVCSRAVQVTEALQQSNFLPAYCSQNSVF